jgi:sensor histidine kinase YesM
MVVGILPNSASSTRTVESEGILRLLLLVLALAMPLATLAYLKIQSTRLSYAMGEIKERIHKEEELQRKLMLERSRFQRDEEVQVYAQKAGLQPRKQGHLVHRAFTPDDQRIAKLRPVSSDGL